MAKINEVVNRVRMEATTQGVDEQISKTKGLVNAQGELVRSSEVLTQASEKSVKGRLSLETPLQKLENRWDKQIMLQRRLTEVERLHQEAMTNQPELVGRYGNVLGKVQTQLDRVTQSTLEAAVAQQKAAQSMVIPTRVPTMIEAVKDSYRSVKEELVPLFGIGQQYKRQIDEVRTALAANQISQTQATAAVQRYRAATHEQVETFKKVNEAQGKYINGTGLARHELINLSRQAQDVGVSLASGQGFATVLMQQGSQIADIFISTGATMKSFWGQIAAGAAFVLKPIVAIPTALLAIGATAVTAAMGFSSGQKDIERSLLGIGKASGATRDDINRIAKESASAFGLSVSEAQEFASALAVTGRIGVEEIGRVVALGKDVARIYGVDAADAAKMLAKAYADPAKGAEELNQRLGSFSAATQENIKNLQTQNKMQEAQSLLTAGIAKGVEGVSATVSRSTTAWEALSNSISNAWRAMGEGLAKKMGMVQDSPVQAINDQLKETERRIEDIKRSMDFSSGATDMPGVSSAAPMDKASMEAARTALQDMQEQAAMLRQHLAQAADEAKKIPASIADQRMVDTAFPLGKQLRDAEVLAEGLNQRLKDIAESGGEASGILAAMGRTLQDVERAARAAASAVADIKEKSGQEGRRVERRESVREEFKGTGIGAEVGMQLKEMQDQLAIAQALTGQEQMRAQEIATTNRLLNEGKTIQEATAVASKQREITQAQINAGALKMLAGLQDQHGVMSATTGQERMAAQETATRNELIRQGVDAEIAGSVAAQERANTQAQINAQSKMQTMQLQNQLQVSQAVGGAAKMEAQERATTKNLIDQGVSSEQAAAQASAERANTQAQINSQATETLLGLQDQFAVASAISGKDKIRAQEQATYNKLVRDGVDAGIAGSVAAQEAANAQAEINSAAERTLALAQGQLGIAQARGGTAKMAATEAAKFNQLTMEGVDAGIAGNIAAAERAAQQEKINEGVENQTRSMNNQTRLLEARTQDEAEGVKTNEGMVKAAIAYEEAIRAGADEYTAMAAKMAVVRNEQAKLAAEEQKAAEQRGKDFDEYVKKLNQNRRGIGGERSGGSFGSMEDSKSIQHGPDEMGRLLLQQEARGLMRFDEGLAARLGPLWSDQLHLAWVKTKEGMERDMNDLFARTGSTTAALNELIGQGGYGAPLSDDQYMRERQEVHNETINRLIDLLPEEDQAAQLAKLLAQVKQQPVTLAREEMIKDLTDKIEGLQDSTDSLNDSMKDILSPLYNQDPRTTRIGYRSDTGVFNPDRYLTEREMGGRKPTPTPVTVPVVPSNDNRGPNPGWGSLAGGTAQTGGVQAPQVNHFNVNISMASGDKQGARETGFQVQQALQRTVGVRVN